jgi:murein DD-endopeptidase MepM/ murein hydrolase activator NlpD
MARIKYYYDTETCRYERVVTSKSDFFINITGFLLVSAVFAGVIFSIYMKFFDSPKELILRKENEELKLNYDGINHQVGELTEVLNSLKDRDDNIYRVIFETQPIPASVRNAGSGGVDKYKEFLNLEFDRNKLISKTLENIDELKKQMYIQSKSYDELTTLAHKKEEMLSSIPAIQPVSNRTLKSLASGFGMRIHPIYKVRKFHTGIDFAAVRGTPVYATGDGVVHIPNNNDGYGNLIEVHHGFGFVTRYAHLDKYKARHGQKVRRGEIVGYVGSTGTATSPHLHYEVIRNSQYVNPIHYFFNDLSPREYEEMLKLASVENQSLG